MLKLTLTLINTVEVLFILSSCLLIMLTNEPYCKVLLYVTLDHKTSNKGNFFKLRFNHNLKVEYISFQLMYGLLG